MDDADDRSAAAADLAATASDLAAATADLVAALEDLRDGPSRPSRGRQDHHEPPQPVEARRFVDDHAVPTAVAVLEANVRALELLQAALGLVDSERATARETAPERSEPATRRASEVGREAIVRADEVLGELLAAVEEGALPPDAAARSVVEDARRLRAEIDDRLAEAAGAVDDDGGVEGAGDADSTDDGGATGDAAQPDAPAGPDDAAPSGAASEGTAESEPDVTVDVEAELESLRSEVGEERPSDEGADDPPDEDASDAGDASDDDEDASDADRPA